MNPTVSIIIVTYNSEKFLPHALSCISEQTYAPKQVVLVDTGSASKDYLTQAAKQHKVHLIDAPKGAAFCLGNNVGYAKLGFQSEYVFFLNPDAYLPPEYIEKAVHYMEAHTDVGVVTGKLLGFDQNVGKPSGRYDSTGIFQTWYGKWYDRGQGELESPNRYATLEEPTAVCGAAMFCRKNALDQSLTTQGHVFDETFWMYKDDIDLSLRVKKSGFKLIYNPNLYLYHCRGWNQDRSKMAYPLRLHSARNELKIHMRELSLVPSIYSFLKYVYVKWVE